MAPRKISTELALTVDYSGQWGMDHLAMADRVGETMRQTADTR